jgi:F-type H+-transporting ATPase subunit b
MHTVLTSLASDVVLATEGGEEHPNPIIPIWQEIVIGTIAFAILCFVLMKFVFPVWSRCTRPGSRRSRAASGGPRSARPRPTRCSSSTSCSSPRPAPRRPASARRRPRTPTGIRQDLLARAREESDRIIAAGKDQLVAERQTIVRELRGEIGTLAVDLASRIVGESLEEEARRKGTVERFLAELDAAPSGGRS